MQIEMRRIDQVKPYERNPRKNEAAVDAVVRSIKEFSFRQPIVVDEDGVVIVGHTRLKAAQKLGMTEVPVHVAVGLSPEKARAYRIADNQTASIAEWDMELLPVELLEPTRRRERRRVQEPSMAMASRRGDELEQAAPGTRAARRSSQRLPGVRQASLSEPKFFYRASKDGDCSRHPNPNTLVPSRFRTG